MTSEITPHENIAKKCLSLAKSLLKEGTLTDDTLLAALVQMAFRDHDKVTKARSIYDWLIKNKVPNDSAWKISGMDSLVAG